MGVRWRTAVLTVTFCALAVGPHPDVPPDARSRVAAATQDGVVVELTLRGADSGPFTVTRVRYRPTMVRFPQRKVVLVEPLLDRTDDAELRRQLRASLRRTRAIIGDVAEPATGS